MSANSNESIQKMRDSQVKGLSICDPRGFTIQTEGTLKSGVLAHASQAFALLRRLDDTKEVPTIRIETNQGSIHIRERDGNTIAIHK